jgi:S1-C subfamily serine protease
VQAAAGTVLWVAGEGDAAFQRFDTNDATWSPTVEGSTIYVATSGAPLTIDQLAIGSASPATTSACSRDAACATGNADLEVASRAVALIRFVKGGSSYSCSGALIADAAGSGTPYFLTARHCISSQEEAASIEAVWDDRAAACGSSFPTATLSRTYGADLLVSSAATDVALLRLKRIPANHTFLGVDLRPLPEGAATYRISHAAGAMQSMSEAVVSTLGTTCPGAPRGDFLYTSLTAGTVSSGSSGAPLLVGLRIVGQLVGVCGASPDDACATYNQVIDGSIAASWPMLASYLAPANGPRSRAARH